MIRIARGRKIVYVAGQAVRRGALELAAGVTGHTVERHVCAGQLIARETGMIESGSGPAVHLVAGIAGRGQLRCLVIERAAGLGVGQVTGEAQRAEARVAGNRRSLVTGLAVNRGMSPEQRETVGMLFGGLR